MASKRAKHLTLIIVAQTACVGVGLWVQLRFAEASIHEEIERDVRAELADGVLNMLDELESGPAVGSSAADFARARLRLPVRAARTQTVTGTQRQEGSQRTRTPRLPSGGEFIVVDRQWRIMRPAEEATGSTIPASEPAQNVSWKSVMAPSAGDGRVLQGTVELAGGLHLASAVAIPDSSGFVVAHCPAGIVASRSSGIAGTLVPLAGMALLWTSALLGIAVHMILSRFYDDFDRVRREAAAESLRHTQGLIRTRDAVIFGLAKLADSRDPETGDHLERISTYATILASALHHHPKFCDEATPAFARLIGISSALHDIGKVGIADRILRKPGSLNDNERAIMATHTTIGGECLREIEQRLGSSNFLQMAREIALHHHERWDGNGYPVGLAGTAIPLSARIVAIVDVYDALSSKRVYKQAISHNECVAVIREEAGKHFDPDLVDVWLRIETTFHDISRQHNGDPPDGATAEAGNAADQAAAAVREERVDVLASVPR